MIWFKDYTLAELKPFMANKSMVSLLDIELTKIGPDYLTAQMPVDERTHQIHGILHGGATCALVETVGSVASLLAIDLNLYYAVGSQINVNHLRSIKTGIVIATCVPVHLGRMKHVWDVRVKSAENDKLIAKGELTCAVLEEKFII